MSGDLPAFDIKKIIWTSAKPIIKIILNVGAGFILAKIGFITPTIAKSFSKIIVNYILPCLLFVNMVESVRTDYFHQFGIMTIMVFFYMLLGGIFGFLFRIFARLPPNFRNGIIAAAIWGNWGDIPLAVMISLGDSAPFRPGDRARGIAYQSVFLILFNVTLFIMGGFKLIQSDYADSANQEALANEATVEAGEAFEAADGPTAGCNVIQSSTSTSATETEHANNATKEVDYVHIEVLRDSTKWTRVQEKTKSLLALIFAPPNLAVITGILVALFPTLKGMFIKSTHPAPEPMLEFLFSYIYSVGGAYVPLALVNLGAALARMNFKAISFRVSFVFAVVKLIVTPAIGISFVLFLVKVVQIIDVDDKPLIFLAMFASCVPTATTVMVLTQFYSPTGEAEEIASMLITQYILGVFTLIGSMILILFLLF
ncbi:auxin efflux carrier [Basidiobolus meristosporus CBS 931.73]|uniref:Auxin efflux carrier n=1 Tax=Basidiobolus meristosporus CBS 931.73 TaxID=1314790 RepID=A0A1Y1X4K5_9FUNG|nr:auxin efflux carrier [Basidiobolus meristosporus CBS 931.73]|eukprot:ORX80750.1 auxin efflux carrier [Basidiobolus meristosporus CBS 931.73]